MTSKRVANAKSDKYHGNILKRGKVELQKVRTQCRRSGCLNLSTPPPPPSPARFARPGSPVHTAFSDWVQRGKALGVGPIMLGFFLFVVVGSGALRSGCVACRWCHWASCVFLPCRAYRDYCRLHHGSDLVLSRQHAYYFVLTCVKRRSSPPKRQAAGLRACDTQVLVWSLVGYDDG